MFSFPSLQVLIMLSVGPALIGFAVLRKFGQGWDTYLTFFFICLNGTYSVVMYCLHMYDYLKPSLTTEKKSFSINEPRHIQNLNNPTYETYVTTVKFDAERNFFRLVLSMHEQGMDVDLTEGFWLKPVTLRSGKQHKRWQGKDAEFRELKKQYEGVIFGRESNNRNARFIIRDEMRLRMAAQGRLPH